MTGIDAVPVALSDVWIYNELNQNGSHVDVNIACVLKSRDFNTWQLCRILNNNRLEEIDCELLP